MFTIDFFYGIIYLVEFGRNKNRQNLPKYK